MVWISTFRCRCKATGEVILLLGDAHIELPMMRQLGWAEQSAELVAEHVRRIASQAAERGKQLTVILELGEAHKNALSKLNLPVPMALIEVSKKLLLDASDEERERINVECFDPRVLGPKAPMSAWVAKSVMPSDKPSNVNWGDLMEVFRTAVARGREDCKMLKAFLRAMARELEDLTAAFGACEGGLGMSDALSQHENCKFSQRSTEHLKLLQWPFDIEFVHRLAAHVRASADEDFGDFAAPVEGTNHAEHVATMMQESGLWEVEQNPEGMTPPPQWGMLLNLVQPTMVVERGSLSSSLTLSEDGEECHKSPLREMHLDM